MPECFVSYLAEVGKNIRWRRARPFALRELRTHLLEQKDCFVEDGMAEWEAEEAAVREMGDAVLVGKEMDAVHRPREQWFWLVVTVLLCCAAVFLRFYLTIGADFAVPDPRKTVAAILFGTVAMVVLYLGDYRVLIRHAGKVYAVAILLGILTYRFGPHVNHTALYTRQVVMFYPVIYAIWLNRCRNKKWEGLMLAAFGGIPLVMIAGMAPYIFGLLMLMFMEVILLLVAAGTDWFGIGRGKTVAPVSVCALAAAAFSCYYGWDRIVFRYASLVHPEDDPMGSGYQALSVRRMISGAVWQGAAPAVSSNGGYSYEHIVPNWEGEFFLTTIACKLGWLFFFLAVGIMLALFGGLLRYAIMERNIFGRLLAVSAVLPLLLGAAGAIVQNLGYFVVSIPIPVFSGNTNMVITMMMLGIALSTLRQRDLPEVQEPAPQTGWKLVFVRE